MAMVLMAGAAGAAFVVYYTGWADSLPWPLSLKPAAVPSPGGDEAAPPLLDSVALGGFGGGETASDHNSDSGSGSGSSESAEQRLERLARMRQLRMPARPPASWGEALSMLAEALRFTYAETLGKWPLADLAFGINYMLRRQVSSSMTLWVCFLPLQWMAA